MNFMSKASQLLGEMINVDALPTTVRFPSIGEEAYFHNAPPINYFYFAFSIGRTPEIKGVFWKEVLTTPLAASAFKATCTALSIAP